ncbi:MAG: hypothetical protein FJW30_04640 [Acidobacteria bacterium]|nr:hypothetical protein [Acidobacteriota bacterium]
MKIILLLSLAAGLTAQDQAGDLLKVKKLHVEKLAGGDTAVHFRDMLIAALQATRLFTITENPDRADTVLRGSSEDLVFTDTYSSSEGVHARTQIGGRGARGSSGIGVGEQESVRISERKHEATASVRLVNKEGDVIWSTTQESTGAKFRGASADVAAKITRQLSEDIARAKNGAYSISISKN